MKIAVLGAAGRMGTLHSSHLIDLEHDVVQVDSYWHRPRQIHDLLKSSDAIVIATPAECHLEHLQVAVEMGKHVFVEKPLCLIGEVADARRLLLEAREKQLVVATGYNLRFHPKVIEAKRRILQGKVLVLWGGFLLRQEPKRPIAHFLEEWASHEVDLALYLLGPVEDYKLIRYRKKGPSEIAAVELMIRHKNGAHSMIYADEMSPPVRKFFLADTDGNIYSADIETDHVKDQDYKDELFSWVTWIGNDGCNAMESHGWLATDIDGLAVIDLLQRVTK